MKHTKRSETERGSDVESQNERGRKTVAFGKTVGNFYKKNVQT